MTDDAHNNNNKNGQYGYIPRTENPYQVLGLDRHQASTYDDREVAKAYRRISLQHHPDKPGGSVEQFRRITASYNLIQTKELRDKYREFGQRLQPGAGEALGETVDKLGPLMLGLAGGILSSWSYYLGAHINLQIVVPILTVGGGPAMSTKAPVMEVLWTSASAWLLGGGLGSVLYGMVRLVLPSKKR